MHSTARQLWHNIMHRICRLTDRLALLSLVATLELTSLGLMGTHDAIANSFDNASAYKAQINDVLDSFGHAAAIAAGADYFSRIAAGDTFMGTGISERWTAAEFKDCARPRFARERGWTYRGLKRHIIQDTTSLISWFDEILSSDTLDRYRGTEIVGREKTGWMVNQYNLTLLSPTVLPIKWTQ
jgi:hypothetical protein